MYKLLTALYCIAFVIAVVLIRNDVDATKQGTFINLGTLSGGTQSAALSINDSDSVVGYSDTSLGNQYSSSHPFLWNSTNGMTDLYSTGFVKIGCGTFTACNAAAVSINASGTIVGWWYNSIFGGAGQKSGFIYDNGTITNLPNFIPTAINNDGNIAGYETLPTGNSEAAYYTGGKVALLGFLPGGDDSQARALNRSEEVVGYSNTPSGQTIAVSWTRIGGKTPSGIIKQLGGLPGFTFSIATGINLDNAVVGYSNQTNGQANAFIRGEGGDMKDLGTPPVSSFATGVTYRGNVSGYSGNAPYPAANLATVMTKAGKTSYIGIFSDGSYSQANAINSSDDEVGLGDTANGVRAFLYEAP